MIMEISKTSALSGDTESIFECKGFKIIATRKGIRFVGESPSIESIEELQHFAKNVADAWSAHKKLIPKIEITKTLPEV